MADKNRISYREHPLSLGSFSNWVRLCLESDGIDREYLPRLFFVGLTTFLTGPLRTCEQLRFGQRIREATIHPSPVFIVGHWRTGTTHLHNLICQDSTFGYVSTFQAMAPEFCLIGNGAIKRFLASRAARSHPTREIDNIPLAFDAPQEEDFAIANMCPHSFLHLYTFPRMAPHFFERYALFRDLPGKARSEWEDAFLTVLRKATLLASGKRLVLKNPVHSGRIPALLELFPDARFIHIYRNPYHVFRSTQIVYDRVVPRAQLQKVDKGQLQEYILQFYVQLMQTFLADKEKIPPRHLVEIRFEDLEQKPLEQLRNIYEALDLPGFSRAEPSFRRYVRSVAGYRKNRYVIDRDVVSRVNEHWQFAFDAWGYEKM